MYDFLYSLRRQVANGCFYSMKSIFFGSVIATLQHCGRAEVTVVVGAVSKEQVDMIIITVQLLNFGS
jgi:hypothetical protein